MAERIAFFSLSKFGLFEAFYLGFFFFTQPDLKSIEAFPVGAGFC